MDREFGRGVSADARDQSDREAFLEKKLKESENRARVAAEGFQASTAAMEEEKQQLISEIKRLQGKLNDKDAQQGGRQSPPADARVREVRLEERQQMLDLDREALEEDKALVEQERRHLLILKGQLDRQQQAIAQRIAAGGVPAVPIGPPNGGKGRDASPGRVSPVGVSPIPRSQLTASPPGKASYSAYLSPPSPKGATVTRMVGSPGSATAPTYGASAVSRQTSQVVG
uniref:Uncharacterized protein n=2 Tax=Hemiselmis andersenii TaxID=464988 RepID=A0A7S1HNR0_HEMAN